MQNNPICCSFFVIVLEHPFHKHSLQVPTYSFDNQSTIISIRNNIINKSFLNS